MQQNLVLRKGINVFAKYLQKIEREVTTSCILHLSELNYVNSLPVLNSRPMFSSHYIVYAEVNELKGKYFEYLQSLAGVTWVRLILEVVSREIFDSLRFNRVFQDFGFLDCYSVKKEVLLVYIKHELLQNGAARCSVTDAVAEKIYKRARYREYILDSVLPLLARTDLSTKTINSYIAPYTGVNLQNIGSKFFDVKKTDVIGKYLSRYSRYPDTIYSRVLAYTKLWMELYAQYITGEFSLENLSDWIEKNGKKYHIQYSYQATVWFDSFSKFSFEYMAFNFATLAEHEDENSNVKIITLYKLLRMVH